MSKKTIAAKDLALTIPVSKIISEQISPENYAEFVTQVTALVEENESLKAENAQLTTASTDLTTRATTAEAQVKSLEDEKLLLAADVASLKPFKAKIEEITAAGRQNGAADLSTQNTDSPQSFTPGSPDALAIAAFKQAKGL